MRNTQTTLLAAACLLLPALGAAAAPLPAIPTQVIRLDTLDLSKMTTGYGTPAPGKSIDGRTLTIKGIAYAHGIGTHAVSEFDIALHGQAKTFSPQRSTRIPSRRPSPRTGRTSASPAVRLCATYVCIKTWEPSAALIPCWSQNMESC